MRRNKPRRNQFQLSNSPRKVAILVDTSTDWSRRLISGIISYLKQHGPWQIFIDPHGVGEHLELQKRWQGDGVIARVTDEKLARSLHARRIPVVNVSGIKVAGPQFPGVISDTPAVARMAVDYFRERGFKHFAYLSLLGLEYVSRQLDAYVAKVQQAGCKCEVHCVKAHLGAQTPDWNLRMETLANWLRSLPKPVAILTWSGGREIIHACQFAGIKIPEEVALMSGTEDLLCEAAHIPISAVCAGSERIGFEAAAMLDDLMRG
ncbi:MAG: XylR family transcriptional regulator, partial [Verrucomicrobiota bacterium]